MLINQGAEGSALQTMGNILRSPRSISGFGALGQEPAAQPGASYQQAFDAAFSTCTSMMTEEDCRRLLGYVPFLCPPPTQKPLTSHPLFWLAIGAVAVKVFL